MGSFVFWMVVTCVILFFIMFGFESNRIDFSLVGLIIGISIVLYGKYNHTNYKGIVVGLIFYTFSYIVYKIIEKIDLKKSEKAYRKERQIEIGKIDCEKLKELVDECNSSQIPILDRQCTCKCKFSNQKPSDSCTYKDEELEYECIAPFGCTCYCSVFNNTVDHFTGCVWNTQDKTEDGGLKCLLSKTKENEELRHLIKSLEKKQTFG